MPTRRRFPRSSPTSRPATSPGTTSSRAGSGRPSTTTSGTSTGRTPRCCASTPTSSSRWRTSGSRSSGSTRSPSSGSASARPARTSPRCTTLTRALRTVARIAAPAVLFKAEAIVGPADLPAYLGVGEHAGKVSDLAYHNGLMVQIWSMLASGDVRLASHALQQVPQPPSTTAWTTYVRCHDDIGWAIADEDAHAVGIDPWAHRRFLSDWYSGSYPGSWARGLVFQQNEQTGDRRISGSLASLAGLEAGDPRSVAADPAGARGDPVLRRAAGDLDGRRARSPQRPRLGRRPGPRRRQPLGAPAPDAVDRRRRGEGPARPHVGPAPPAGRTPLAAAPACRLAHRGVGPPRPGRAARRATPPRRGRCSRPTT